MLPATARQISQKIGYMPGHSFSGTRMFMPYTPARNESGMKIVLITVSTFMISFMRLEIADM